MSKLFKRFLEIDKLTFLLSLSLMIYGWLMLASASMPYADFYYHNPFFFLSRQAVFMGMGLVMGLLMFSISPHWWARWRHGLLFFSILSLIIVLIPGVGHAVKGSLRWVRVGPFQWQASELAKLCTILYLAGFVQKHPVAHVKHYSIFLRPILVVSVVASLVLLEPDFGTVCVLMAVSLVQLFVAGTRLRYVLAWLMLVSLVLGGVVLAAPYRVQRWLSFLHPELHETTAGYQLLHALMAISSGGWMGNGLGESMEKLFYLPEAHTDFLLAIMGEELGFLGLVSFFALFLFLVLRLWWFSLCAMENGSPFLANVLAGIASWWSFQALINIGVNLGCLPTKGITLPFISYGGSSMLVCCMGLGLALRCILEVKKLKK